MYFCLHFQQLQQQQHYNNKSLLHYAVKTIFHIHTINTYCVPIILNVYNFVRAMIVFSSQRASELPTSALLLYVRQSEKQS